MVPKINIFTYNSFLHLELDFNLLISWLIEQLVYT